MPELQTGSVGHRRGTRQVWSLPLRIRLHPILWIAIGTGILMVEYLTGPYVQVAILFVFPVALATWSYGRIWGFLVAVILPLLRLPFFYYLWHVPVSWSYELIDTAIKVLVLLALAWVVDFIARQRREIYVLEGMLPVCGFCKRIRDEGGGWVQMERYIADRSEARFSHGLCPECAQRHYGDLGV
jgi:hypothetical protein